MDNAIAVLITLLVSCIAIAIVIAWLEGCFEKLGAKRKAKYLISRGWKPYVFDGTIRFKHINPDYDSYLSKAVSTQKAIDTIEKLTLPPRSIDLPPCQKGRPLDVSYEAGSWR